jgi:hypothetical protein
MTGHAHRTWPVISVSFWLSGALYAGFARRFLRVVAVNHPALKYGACSGN